MIKRRKMMDYKLDPPEAPRYPLCPKCGSDDYTYIVFGEDGWEGCECCVLVKDAEEYWAEQMELDEEERDNYAVESEYES